MSRLIVKNIPKWIKEERLKNQFNSVGPLTDCSLKYNKEGVFRKFAFIGYRTAEEAQTAIRMFHNTYLDTQKIQVELAKDFGDVTKLRAWSKYSKESSSYQKIEEEKKPEEDKKKKKEKKKKEKTKNPVVEEILGDLKDDPSFKEFLDVHQNVGAKPVWGDVTEEKTSKGDKHVPSIAKSDLPFDDDTDEEEEEQNWENLPSGVEKMETHEGQEQEVTKHEVQQIGLSDLDYLKSKVNSNLLSESSDSDDNEQKVSPNQKDKKKKKRGKEKEKSKNDEAATQNSEPENSADSENQQSKKKKKGKKKKDKREDEESSKTDKKKENEAMHDSEVKIVKEQGEVENDNEATGKDATDDKIDEIIDVIHILKVKGIPPTSGEKTVREFFHPIKIVSLRMPKNAKNNSVGIAYVGFKCEEDVLKALGRNKNFIGGKRTFVNRYKVENVENKNREKPRPWENKTDEAGGTEDIADTGRLYLRNLSYTCTEEDLEKTFSKFGPLVEVHLPVDYLTKKVKGFAFITFMMPEHAVKAFTEMDGKVYQGRMLHVLPGKEKVEEEDPTDEKSSFKKQKQQKQKAMAGSSHNWNTLFLGANTVADVMVDKYQTAKSDILDNNVKGSLGVRMALGETQIVSETRDFLIKNGVSLDSFSQASAPRSKSVLLAKNLPAGTKVSEIQTLFSKHGALGRVILPPSGVTAIIEYKIPTEAKLAFRRLAYSKFHHIPLYLEWAPVEVFTSQAPPTTETTPTTQATPTTEATPPELNDTEMKEAVEEKTRKEHEMKEENTEKNDNEDEDDEDEPGSVLFVKNLNFDTKEDSLKQLFEKCAKVRSASISKKKDLKNPGKMLSLGYGFVEFKFPDGAMRVLQKMQHTELDGHALELKISNKTTLKPKGQEKRKKQKETKQKTTKILVRNIPFEAKQHELVELFKVFGEIKSVRLPKKLSGTGSHRGFGFVDFLTLHDAKRAFEALCHSTHLYGRRLVLEWANTDDDIDEIRKRTAENYNEGGGKKKKFTKSGLVESLEGSLAGEMGL